MHTAVVAQNGIIEATYHPHAQFVGAQKKVMNKIPLKCDDIIPV
jgi:hypothetical protein